MSSTLYAVWTSDPLVTSGLAGVVPVTVNGVKFLPPVMSTDVGTVISNMRSGWKKKMFLGCPHGVANKFKILNCWIGVSKPAPLKVKSGVKASFSFIVILHNNNYQKAFSDLVNQISGSKGKTKKVSKKVIGSLKKDDSLVVVEDKAKGVKITVEESSSQNNSSTSAPKMGEVKKDLTAKTGKKKKVKIAVNGSESVTVSTSPKTRLQYKKPQLEIASVVDPPKLSTFVKYVTNDNVEGLANLFGDKVKLFNQYKKTVLADPVNKSSANKESVDKMRATFKKFYAAVSLKT